MVTGKVLDGKPDAGTPHVRRKLVLATLFAFAVAVPFEALATNHNLGTFGGTKSISGKITSSEQISTLGIYLGGTETYIHPDWLKLSSTTYAHIYSFTAAASGTMRISSFSTSHSSGYGSVSIYAYATSTTEFYNLGSGTMPVTKGAEYYVRVYSTVALNQTFSFTLYVPGSSGGGGGTTTKPDLKPYKPDGWASSLVVNKSSSSPGSTSASFTDSDTIYVHWAFINNGSDISSTFYIYLYVDGVREASWPVSGLRYGYYNHTTSGQNIGNLSVGTHKIKVVADVTGVVSESDEGNNTVERTITVTRDTSCYQTVYISFSPGGGSGSMSTVTRTIDYCSSSSSSYTLPACSFTRSGYTFAGWQVYNACEAASTLPVRQPGYVISDLCGNITLTATWKANNPSYTLTLDPYGGTLQGNNFGSANGTTQTASVKVTYGKSSYANLGRAARNGYTFTGWWTSPSGGTRVFDSNGNWIIGSYWNSSKQWIYKGNVYLYAQWRENNPSYTLTLDPNGGTLLGNNFGWANGTTYSADVTVTYGKSSYANLGRASRSGYTFTGWWTSPSGGTRVFDSNGNWIAGSYWNSSKQWIYKGNVYLYAQWRENVPSYTLTLDPYGGTLQGNNFGSANGTTRTASVTVTYGKSSYANLGRATWSGYTFTGWWTSPSGGTRVFDSNGNWIIGSYWNSSKQWIYKGNVYLYAQWRAGGQQTYTLTVDPDGHSLVGNNFGAANGTDQIAKLTVTYGKSNYSALGRSDWWPMMEKTGGQGHTFLGWYTVDGEQVFDANGHAVVGTYWDENKCWQYKGNLTVYGDWIQGGYTFGGDATWAVENDLSLRSGRIGHSQSSSIETSVSKSGKSTGGTLTVTFSWKVSSESNYDCLIFYVDGVEKARISGETDWTSMSFTVNDGARVRWTYSKDGSVSSGSDCGWVDCIMW